MRDRIDVIFESSYSLGPHAGWFASSQAEQLHRDQLSKWIPPAGASLAGAVPASAPLGREVVASGGPGRQARLMAMVEPAEVDAAILAYYASGREKARLETSCRLEFLRTQELLTRFLPRQPASIVDVGGGAGIHAVPLIAAGYEVTLVDPVELHVEQARASGINRAWVGDARTLQFPEGSFDAVLLLGPLYHLPHKDDRLMALREGMRVLRPGGVLAAAAISRFASTYDGLHAGFLQDPDFERIVEGDVATGVHLNPKGRRGWFTTAYMHRPDELAAELREAGFAVEELLAIEGPGSLITDVDEWLDDDNRREVLMRAIRRVEAEPAILGASSHLLAVARAVSR